MPPTPAPGIPRLPCSIGLHPTLPCRSPGPHLSALSCCPAPQYPHPIVPGCPTLPTVSLRSTISHLNPIPPSHMLSSLGNDFCSHAKCFLQLLVLRYLLLQQFQVTPSRIQLYPSRGTGCDSHTSQYESPRCHVCKCICCPVHERCSTPSATLWSHREVCSPFARDGEFPRWEMDGAQILQQESRAPGLLIPADEPQHCKDKAPPCQLLLASRCTQAWDAHCFSLYSRGRNGVHSNPSRFIQWLLNGGTNYRPSPNFSE